jgi:hypothetical protein
MICMFEFHHNRLTGVYKVTTLHLMVWLRKPTGRFNMPEYKYVVNLLSTESIELMTWYNENTPISHYEDKFEFLST